MYVCIFVCLYIYIFRLRFFCTELTASGIQLDEQKSIFLHQKFRLILLLHCAENVLSHSSPWQILYSCSDIFQALGLVL